MEPDVEDLDPWDPASVEHEEQSVVLSEELRVNELECSAARELLQVRSAAPYAEELDVPRQQVKLSVSADGAHELQDPVAGTCTAGCGSVPAARLLDICHRSTHAGRLVSVLELEHCDYPNDPIHLDAISSRDPSAHPNEVEHHVATRRSREVGSDRRRQGLEG